MLLKNKKIILLLIISIILLINSTIIASASCESKFTEVNTSKVFKKYLKLTLYSFLQNPNSNKNPLNFSELNQSLRFFINETKINETIICTQSQPSYVMAYAGINITSVVEKMITKPPRNVIPRCLSGEAKGTQFGECAEDNQPNFCLQGRSVQRCGGPDNNFSTTEDNCGCPSGLACNPNKGICETPCTTDLSCTTYNNYCDSSTQFLMLKTTTYTCNSVCINPIITNSTFENCPAWYGLDCNNNKCMTNCVDNSDCTSTYNHSSCLTGPNFCVRCLTDNNCSRFPGFDKRCYDNKIQEKFFQQACEDSGTINATCGPYYDDWVDNESCNFDDTCSYFNPNFSYPPSDLRCISKPLLRLQFNSNMAPTFEDSFNSYDFGCTGDCPIYYPGDGIQSSPSLNIDFDDYISRPDFDYGPNFTINLFFKPTSPAANQQFLFGHGMSNDNGGFIRTYYRNDQLCTIIQNSAGTQSSHEHSTLVSPFNNWFMLTITVNQTVTNTFMKMYVNGIFDQSSDITNANYNPVTQFVIGNNDDFDRSFRGLIDEFSLWNKTLTPQEIRHLYRFSN
jgi:hypothetical protein